MIGIRSGKRGAAARSLVAPLVAATLLVAGCGAGEAGDDAAKGKGTQLSWYIFNEPSGVLPEVAQKCADESNGRYTVAFEYLPSDADQQREQLVRRLGAEDEAIDIIGMDVIWTGEFANAGWVEEWTGDDAQAVTQGVFDSVAETARYEDKLWAAPIWTNTQILWYRTDRVDQPPRTWEQMLQEAERIGANGKIQVQANRYEGLTAWFNTMVESAGTSVVQPDDAQEVNLAQEPTERALRIMVQLANSGAADPAMSTSDEDTARLSFEDGASSFMLNYPFVHPSAEENSPQVFKNMGQAPYPRVDPNRPAAPPLGGINLGVSAYSDNKDLAFEAIRCLRRPENQIEIAKAAGLPPVTESLYAGDRLNEVYPGFVDVLKQAIDEAAPRPVAVAYQDLSLAIQRTIHPLDGISQDQIAEKVEELRTNVQTALNVEGLL